MYDIRRDVKRSIRTTCVSRHLHDCCCPLAEGTGDLYTLVVCYMRANLWVEDGLLVALGRALMMAGTYVHGLIDDRRESEALWPALSTKKSTGRPKIPPVYVDPRNAAELARTRTNCCRYCRVHRANTHYLSQPSY